MKKFLAILYICSSILMVMVIPLLAMNGINVSAKVLTVIIITFFITGFFVFDKKE